MARRSASSSSERRRRQTEFRNDEGRGWEERGEAASGMGFGFFSRLDMAGALNIVWRGSGVGWSKKKLWVFDVLKDVMEKG